MGERRLYRGALARFPRAGLTAVLIGAYALGGGAQRRDAFDLSLDHPVIAYRQRPTTDPVGKLADDVARGALTLSFDPDNGYLRSLLERLGVPVESQVVVFSGGSKQAELISASNPRAIYFNDSVAIGWVRGAAELEIAAVDPEQGAVFYSLDQRQTDRPTLQRDKGECLQCHVTWESRGVPGFVVMSTLNEPAPDDKYSYATGSVADHRSPFNDRWGGWFVTGQTGPVRHLGNDTALPRRTGLRPDHPRPLESLAGLFDQRGFLSAHSDVVALMVLEHQSAMANLLTWTSWEARVSESAGVAVGPVRPGEPTRADRVQYAVNELVDYMLFIDEAPLVGPVRGSSRFAEVFTAAGPRDARGRSLRQVDLEQRLLRYPCSYLIYGEAFERLPPATKTAVYARLWQILSGQEGGSRYARLGRDDRQAIVEILRETKRDLPEMFKGTLTR